MHCIPTLTAALLLCGAACFSAAAPAQSATDAPVHILPSTGLWWSPGENGQFLQLAIGPGGYVLATLTESDGNGQPTYRVLQGPFEAADARAGTGLGRVQSNFYRVLDSTCLECGPADGRTVDTGRAAILRFVDGTHAELLDRSHVVRRYELYPLLTAASQTTAERVAGQRFLLTAQGESTLVRLERTDTPATCLNPDPDGAVRYRLQFEQQDSALRTAFADLDLQIAPGINPRIVAKVEVPLFQRFCVQPGSFFTCVAYEIRMTRSTRCETAYAVSESDGKLRGAALPNAGSGLLQEFDGSYSAQTPPRFTGALTLQPLPVD